MRSALLLASTSQSQSARVSATIDSRELCVIAAWNRKFGVNFFLIAHGGYVHLARISIVVRRVTRFAPETAFLYGRDVGVPEELFKESDVRYVFVAARFVHYTDFQNISIRDRNSHPMVKRPVRADLQDRPCGE